MSSTDTSTTASDPHAPLLRPHQDPSSASPTSTATLALLIGRATGRRGPSMLVRETAARELEERRVDWGYSKPVVALDMLWNSAFVAVSVIMLIVTIHERPNTPIRVWICGYALQSLVHVVLVWLEYRRRNRRRVQDAETSQGMQGEREPNGNDSEDDDASNRSSSRSKLASILFVH